jgi:High-affinity nickel-transport protein
MFGLDHDIQALSANAPMLVVILVAGLLGLRHATDPDHIAAVTTLAAGEGDAKHAAGRLGFAWGLGHATSLFVFGVPIVLFNGYLPEPVQVGAEAAVGVLIIALAVRLLLRWRSGALGHAHPHRARTLRQAYGIGLVHGTGGSAGVGILLLATIPSETQALAALAVFAICTAISMAAASTTFGLVLTRDAVAQRYFVVAPALGALSLAFGVWYALGAVGAVPYVF